MSHPHIPIDPRDADPLDVTYRELVAQAELEQDAWDAGYAAAVSDRRWRRTELLLAAIAGAVLAAALTVVVVNAATLPATSEALPASATIDGGSSAASLVPGAPLPIPGARPAQSAGRDRFDSGGLTGGAPQATDPPAIAGGLASYVGQSFGPRYLALPNGRGHRVRICGPVACIVRTSTDAGPDLAMQRQGRVADVSYVDFRALCGCHPETVGVVAVTVEDFGPATTPPPTDTH